VEAAVEAASLVGAAYGGKWSAFRMDAERGFPLLGPVAEERGLDLCDAVVAFETHVDLRRPPLRGVPTSDREFAYFLGRTWAECGTCKELNVQRMLARRLFSQCVPEGQAEGLRAGREMVRRGARHPTVASFLNGVRSGFKADGRGRVGTRTDAARRRLVPMLKPLFAEYILEQDAASALKDAQLARLSGLELDVLAELGPLLAAMKEPPKSRAALVRVVAEAFKKVKRKDEVEYWKESVGGLAANERKRAEPDLDATMKMLARELPVLVEIVNGLLEVLRLPLEVGLVPKEGLGPGSNGEGEGCDGADGDGESEEPEEPEEGGERSADDAPADGGSPTVPSDTPAEAVEAEPEPKDPLPRAPPAEPGPGGVNEGISGGSAPPVVRDSARRLLVGLPICSRAQLREAQEGLDMLTPAQRRILLFQE